MKQDSEHWPPYRDKYTALKWCSFGGQNMCEWIRSGYTIKSNLKSRYCPHRSLAVSTHVTVSGWVLLLLLLRRFSCVPNIPKQRGVAWLSLRKVKRPMCRGQREREGDCMVTRYWLGTQLLEMRETILGSWNFIPRSLGNHWILLKYDHDMIRSAFSEENGLERGRNGCRKVLPGDNELRFPYCTEDLSHFLVLLHAPTKLNTLF